MVSRTKRLIPVELLRRSCRSASKNTTISANKVEKESSNEHQSGRHNPDLKRLKSDDLLDRNNSVQRTKVKSEHHDEETDKDIPDSSTTIHSHIDLKADGILQIDAEELDLERTLLGGQSFRWTKSYINDNNKCETIQKKSNLPIFTGVVSSNALQLWRNNQESIAFKVLNREYRDLKEIATLLEDYFQLKYKLKDLYKQWSIRDGHLKECCQSYQGFRILRQDPVENVFSFICATNNNIKRISQMVDKLCKRFGSILEKRSDDDECPSIYDSYYTFPSVERLAQDDVFDCLRYELGFGYRAKFITETAKKLVSQSQNEQNRPPREYLLSLRQRPYRDTCKQLMQFPGIGRKVADCICLMSMDHLNSVPIDCHIYEIVCRNYMPKLREERKTLTESVHDLIGNYFNDLHGPLAGWATSVLFIAELKHLRQQEGSDSKSVAKNKTKNKAKAKQTKPIKLEIQS